MFNIYKYYQIRLIYVKEGYISNKVLFVGFGGFLPDIFENVFLFPSQISWEHDSEGNSWITILMEC